MRSYSMRRRSLPVWHGTQQEATDLLNATRRYCSCVLDDSLARVMTCPPHAMMFSDQRALDGLIFARHISRQLMAEEFATVIGAVVA
jgi:hypothetical protein